MKKGKKRRAERRVKTSLSALIGERLEIDADTIAAGSLVEIRGRNRAEVSGVRKIASYTTERVVLVIRRGTVAVCGEGLTCVFYRSGEAAVEGNISSVCFSEEEGG